jgi:hypothetical protein
VRRSWSADVALFPGWMGSRDRRIVLAVLLAGLFLRVLPMPFTMHADPRFVGDLPAMHFDAQAAVRGDVVGEGLSPLYPPLAYLTMRAYQIIIGPLLPDLDGFDNTGRDAWRNWFEHPHLFQRLLLLKAWIIPFDLVGGLLLMRLGRSAREAKWLAAYWFLNPVLIYTGYVHGQFDVVPACFSVLALWLLGRGRALGAALALGVGAAYKTYPLLLLPPLALLAGRDLWGMVRLMAAGVAPWLAGQLLLPSGTLAVSHPFYAGAFVARYDAGYGQVSYLFVIGYTALMWAVWRWRGRWEPGEGVWRVWLVILLGYYVQAAFDLHYLTWAVPMFGLFLLRQPSSRLPTLALVALVPILYLRVPPGAFLRPLGPAIEQMPSLAETIGGGLPMDVIEAMARSALLGTLLWLAVDARWPLVGAKGKP